jgi:hypothetical protein
MHPRALDGQVMDAGSGRERVGNRVQLGGDGGPGQVPQSGQRARRLPLE